MSFLSVVNLIEKKRKSQELSDEEIEYFVKSVSNFSNDDGSEPADPSQIGAMLMAMYLNGFSAKETHALTECMFKSGTVLRWPNEYKHLVVDKHSTGGVGDKVSLVLAPALAAVGLKVPMISGRALGFTGGTLTKLESIPGYRTELSSDEIKSQVQNVGCCIVEQTEDIVPADRVLYRCRDLTATIDHKSLITASIVSKKLAEGISALVYDVKFGRGAFFQHKEAAEELAKMLISASSPTKCSALLTSMEYPLGNQIGNSLEVMEAIDCLRGCGPEDVIEVVVALGAELLGLTDKERDLEVAKESITRVINDGTALKKFSDMIIAQGVSTETARELCYGEMTNALKQSSMKTNVKYDGPEGYVQEIDALFLAEFCREMFSADSSQGLTIRKHVGEKISKDEVWLVIHHQEKLSDESLKNLRQAIKIGATNTNSRKRVYKRITSNQKGDIIVLDVHNH